MSERLTTTEAAARLGLTPQMVRRHAQQGRLPHVREETPRGPVLWFRPEDLDAFQRRPRGRPKRQG